MKNYVIAIAIFVAIALVGAIVANKEEVGLGSIGNEAYNATSTAAIADGFSQVKTSSGTLGSVVITGASAQALTIWNATSTTDSASTTIVTIPASTAAGTYTFDLQFDRGLILEAGSSFDVKGVVTWK